MPRRPARGEHSASAWPPLSWHRTTPRRTISGSWKWGTCPLFDQGAEAGVAADGREVLVARGQLSVVGRGRRAALEKRRQRPQGLGERGLELGQTPGAVAGLAQRAREVVVHRTARRPPLHASPQIRNGRREPAQVHERDADPLERSPLVGLLEPTAVVVESQRLLVVRNR